MRAEKNDPHRAYNDFWDWLRVGSNTAWMFILLFGYLYYLLTTEEV